MPKHWHTYRRIQHPEHAARLQVEAAIGSHPAACPNTVTHTHTHTHAHTHAHTVAHTPQVEAAVGSHPAVAAAAVTGLPDARMGEAVAALIILRPGWAWQGPNASLDQASPAPSPASSASPTHAPVAAVQPPQRSSQVLSLELLQKFCKEAVGLSPYKLPRFVAQLQGSAGGQPPALPLNASGKVVKAPVKAALLRASEQPQGARSRM